MDNDFEGNYDWKTSIHKMSKQEELGVVPLRKLAIIFTNYTLILQW